MKTSKKVLSVILALTMIMTTLSVCFTAFGAGTLSGDALTNLVDALKNDTVADISNYSVSGTKTTIADPNGDIIKALDAYRTAYIQVRGTSNPSNSNNTYRTSTMINNIIKTAVQEAMGSTAFDEYKTSTVLSAFNANQNVDATIGVKNAPSSGIQISIAATVNESALLEYADADALPDDLMSSYSVNFNNTRGNAGSLWSAKYYYYAAAPSNPTKNVYNVSAIKALAAKVEDNSDVIGISVDEMLNMDSEELYAAYTDLNTAYTALKNAKFSEATVNHFFNVVDIESTIDNLDYAYKLKEYLPIVEEIEEGITVDFSNFSLSEIESHYTTLKAKYDNYNKLDADVKEALVTATGLDTNAVDTYLNDANTYYKKKQIEAIRDEINEKLEVVDEYEEVTVTDGDLTGAQIAIDINFLSGKLSALIKYDMTLINEVCQEGYVDRVNAAISKLNELAEVAKYNVDFLAKWNEYTAELEATIDLDADSEELLEALMGIDTWYAGLETFEAELADNLGAETAALIVKDMSEKMHTKIDAQYAILANRVTTQIEVANVIFDSLVTLYGDEIKVANMETIRSLKAAFNSIEVEAYEYLKETSHYDLDAAVIEKYENIAEYVEAYKAYLASGGFDNFETSEIADLVREVSTKDIVRDKDFVVDDEKLDEVLTILDRMLSSDEIKSLGLDLEGTINGLTDTIYGLLFNDDMINTIVDAIFPMLCKLIVPIWSTLLPSELIIPEGTAVVGGKRMELNIYDAQTAVGAIGVNIFPSLLAKDVKDNYPEIADLLAQASEAPTYEVVVNPETGEEEEIVTTGWDNPILRDEEGKLALEWGVTDKDSFIKAFCSIAKSFDGVLTAVLGNKDAHIEGYSIGNGTIYNVNLIMTFDVYLNMMQVLIDVGHANAFNNVLAPIFEALGFEKDEIPDGDQLGNTSEFLYAIFDLVETLIGKLAANPIDFVTKALPNLAFALETGKIDGLLNVLSIPLTVKAGVPNVNGAVGSSNGLAGGVLNGIKGSLGSIINLADMIDGFPSNLVVGDLLDLSSLEINGKALDLSFNGILSLVAGLLGEGISLPKADVATLATLGSVAEKDTRRTKKSYTWGTEGKAAYIEANRADVIIFVLEYLTKVLAQEGLLDDVIAVIAGEDAEVEIPEIAVEIINKVKDNYSDVVAAIVELVYPVEYSNPIVMAWKDLSVEADEDDDYAMPDAEEVLYTENWTKEKAEYVAEHLPKLVDNIILLFGVKIGDEKAESLGNLVENALDEYVYSPSLIKTIQELIAGLDETIKNVITNIVGIDLDKIANIDADFENGDVDAFKVAINELLSEVVPALQAILADENWEINFTDEDGSFKTITVEGFAGYTNGLMPLLCSLGAEGVLSTDEFIADKDNIVNNILNPIMSIIDKVVEDPYTTVETIVPNLLYFIASDGLNVAIENLLYAVNQILDTIRPIYDINLYDIIPFDLKALQLDPVGTLMNLLSKKIEEVTGNSLKIDYTINDIFSTISFGDKVETKDADGRTMYRIENVTSASADMVTIVLRYVVGELMLGDNLTILADFVRQQYGISDEAYAFLYSLLYAVRYAPDASVDATLAIFAYIFYGIDTSVTGAATGYDFINYDWQALYNRLLDSEVPFIEKIGDVVEATYSTAFKVVYDKYSRDRLNDLLDRLPVEDDKKEQVNFFLDFINNIIEKIKELFEILKNAFGM